jgi:carbon-monoxide dehydrogenase medium subunit
MQQYAWISLTLSNIFKGYSIYSFMRPRSFEFYNPKTLSEAVEILYSREESKLLAGGQSLIPMMKLRIFSPEELISITGIKELQPYIKQDGDLIKIGSTTTHDMLGQSDLLRKVAPVLSEAASEIADQQIRNRGTIGGNIAHGDPSTNLSAALLVLDADIEVVGKKGKRVIPIKEFFIDLFTTALEHDEIITEISFKTPKGTKQKFMKIAKSDTAFPMAFVAVSLKTSNNKVEEARLALGVAGPVPMRAIEAEDFLRGKKLEKETNRKAAQIASENLEPPADVHASAEYRKQLLKVLVQRSLDSLME